MARANKYTSINFNHIYDKDLSNNNTNPTKHRTSSASSLYSAVSSPNGFNNATTRTHGRMLVLTRPTSKPITTPPLSPSPQAPSTQLPQQKVPDQPRSEPDSISLRPLGRTGSGSGISAPVLGQTKEKEEGAVVGSSKPNRFVPPHLRPGFVGKEERPGPEVFRAREPSQRQQGNFGTPGGNNENGRPKSGGYERMRVGESTLGLASRPRSSGNRPNSSG
ncbi:translation initiation factor IF-2-like isoform X2 [Tripterygium wilfordii]|nr:translation initiation factor IF-2-like isoform X1 [Tripterygium wilfordii]XP_038708149.1 translation initiation factor IF-2-like isoform X2 [Tripterygium wilfordii]